MGMWDGRMLTVAEETLQEIARKNNKQVAIHLYGRKSIRDLRHYQGGFAAQGRGEEAELQTQLDTLARWIPLQPFRLYALQPPYGKSWKTDLERMAARVNRDPRFVIEHAGDRNIT